MFKCFFIAWYYQKIVTIAIGTGTQGFSVLCKCFFSYSGLVVWNKRITFANNMKVGRLPSIGDKVRRHSPNIGRYKLRWTAEKLEKTQFTSVFGWFYNSQILMLLANNYGSKTPANGEKIKLLFDKSQLKYSLQKAKADSFTVEKDAIQFTENECLELFLFLLCTNMVWMVLFGVQRNLRLWKNQTFLFYW